MIGRMSPEELDQEIIVYIKTYGRELPILAFAPKEDLPTSSDNPMVLIAGTEHR
jgi:hypothetical protein